MTQGFGAAVKLGITYEQLVDTVGIHPTGLGFFPSLFFFSLPLLFLKTSFLTFLLDAEQLVGLKITKASGESPNPPGC